MAEPLTDKELAEFRRRVEGLHDMSLGTSMRVGMERRILATIARLEAQNEAMAEALKIVCHERDQVGKDEPVWVLDPAFDICAAALSPDAGKGYTGPGGCVLEYGEDGWKVVEPCNAITGWLPPVQPERLAQIFHESYERLAPEFGYKTREASAMPWEDVPEANKRLMIATAHAALDALKEE